MVHDERGSEIEGKMVSKNRNQEHSHKQTNCLTTNNQHRKQEMVHLDEILK